MQAKKGIDVRLKRVNRAFSLLLSSKAINSDGITENCRSSFSASAIVLKLHR